MKKIIAIVLFILSFILSTTVFISKDEYNSYLAGGDNFVKAEDYNNTIDELIGDVPKNDSVDTDDSQDDSDTKKDELEKDTQTKKGANSGESNTVGLDKDALTKEQSKIFDELLKQVRDFKPEYTIVAKDDKDVIKAYNALAQEYPEYFWISAAYSWVYSEDGTGNLTVVLTQKSGYDMKKLKKLYDEMMLKANSIISQVKNKKSDYETILYVHDQLADNIHYDFEAYKINKKGNLKTLLLSSTAYNAIVKDKAICSGYSAAFQMIMNKLGYKCGRISGSEKNKKEGHEWNYINVGGKYYYIDVTWDSPTSDEKNASKPKITHDYFCITEKELTLTHDIRKGELKPVCNSMDLDYYKHNGAYFNTYDFETFKKLVQSNNNSCSMKFASQGQAVLAKKDLFDNKKFFDIIDKEVSWNISQAKNILTVYY